MTAPLTFVYVAVGEKYVGEAAQSAASCKSAMPSCRTVLHTSERVRHEVFDSVEEIGSDKEDPFLSKIRGIAAETAERFVFLDTDTYVVDDVSEVFALLDKFDMAAAHAPVKLQSNIWPELKPYGDGIPECFPEFNTGVIAIKNSERVRAVLARWESLFVDHLSRPLRPKTQDQASFRTALYESDLRVCTLPAEYNCRFPYPMSLCGKVKILHGHGSEDYLKQLSRAVNRSRGFRALSGERFTKDFVILRSARRSGPNRRS